MTNQTNLDYLFKLTAPVSERGAGGQSSSSGRRPAFDDHLVNASSADSSSIFADRKKPTDSVLSEGVRPSGTRSDDHFKTSGTNSDAQADATEQVLSGLEDQSSDDAATGDSETAAEQNAADQLAAAAAVTQHAAQISKEDPALTDDQRAESTESTSKLSSDLGGDVDQSAGNRLFVHLNDAAHATGDAALDVEIENNAPAKSLGGRKPANEPRPADVAENDDKRQHESSPDRSGLNANAIDTSALAKNSARGADAKPGKAIAAGRRGANHSNESAEEGRASAPTATNRADTNVSPNAAVVAATVNISNAQLATAAGGEASEHASQTVKPLGHNSEGLHLTIRGQRSRAAGGRRTHAAQSGAELPRVDAARFVGRVAKAVQTAQDRGGVVQLRLSPPELGSLRLELSMQNGVMTAAVETESPAARQVLLDHLPALRERLAEQNIRIERFDVDVRQENSGGQADPRAQQEHRQHQPQQPRPRHVGGRQEKTQPSTGDAPHVLTRLTNSELNVLA